MCGLFSCACSFFVGTCRERFAQEVIARIPAWWRLWAMVRTAGVGYALVFSAARVAAVGAFFMRDRWQNACPDRARELDRTHRNPMLLCCHAVPSWYCLDTLCVVTTGLSNRLDDRQDLCALSLFVRMRYHTHTQRPCEHFPHTWHGSSYVYVRRPRCLLGRISRASV